MQLKRYKTEELQKICEKIFFDYLLEQSAEGITNAEKVYMEYLNRIERYERRIDILADALNRSDFKTYETESMNTQLKYLKKGHDLISSMDMNTQKRYFELTNKTDFCRTTVQVPLDKKLNSYYDDLTLQVLFYDDVCTPCGKINEFKSLPTREEKLEFLKRNIEITNMGLAYFRGSVLKAVISLKGNLNFNDPRVKGDHFIFLLPQEFSNFKKLRLSDTSAIYNNDLKQFIQSKIDLDKENMTLLSSLIIRGDRYDIYRSNDEELFIRYVCRSTGRVYYNKLILENLALSSYFHRDDYDSYSKAWWNLNTLGGNPDGDPVIRC